MQYGTELVQNKKHVPPHVLLAIFSAGLSKNTRVVRKGIVRGTK